jgi:hypothetical protein
MNSFRVKVDRVKHVDSVDYVRSCYSEVNDTNLASTQKCGDGYESHHQSAL